MTIFDFISDILFTKKRNLNTIDEEQEFSPYLINRWLSMYSTSWAKECNKINKYLSVFENKRDLYTLFFNVMPRVPSKKIQYFKKTKESKDAEQEIKIKTFAHNSELSTREIREYMHTLNSATN